MDKDKRLIKASWWERLTVGDTVLMGGVMLIKSSIQFSIDGWGCVPSLLFTCSQTMVGKEKSRLYIVTLYVQSTL